MSETETNESLRRPPTLSVVLPNYNHAHLLPRALDALLAQTRPPDEIIVVNDASTDDSIAVIERFAARAPSIRILRSERNFGAVAALDRGLKAATGTHVYFAAADDWVMNDFFEIALNAFEENPRLRLFCGEVQVVDGPSNRPAAIRPAVRPVYRARFLSSDDVRRLLAQSDNWILTGAAVLRRDAIDCAGGFSPNVGSFSDGLLLRKIALRYGFFFAPKVVMTWCVYPDSVSRKLVSQLDRAQEALTTVTAYLSRDPTFPDWYRPLFRKRWMFAVCRAALRKSPVCRRTLATMGPQSFFDRMFLGFCLSLLGRFAYVPATAWLALRLHPYPLGALLRTAVSRYFDRLTLKTRQ